MSGSHLSKDFFDLVKAIGESKSKQEEDRIIMSEVLSYRLCRATQWPLYCVRHGVLVCHQECRCGFADFVPWRCTYICVRVALRLLLLLQALLFLCPHVLRVCVIGVCFHPMLNSDVID